MMNTWLLGIAGTLLTAMAIAVGKWVWRELRRHREEHKYLMELKPFVEEHRKHHNGIEKMFSILSDANKEQLKDRIVQQHQHAITKGGISIYERESFKGKCQCYYALGGNSFVEKLEQEIDALPTIYD